MEPYIEARANMVDCQLRPNQVKNLDLLQAFLSTPRERFVSSNYASLAYSDQFIKLSPERVMMPPMLLGKLLQECQITKKDIILDVACGRGYGCAILSKLASTVVGIESDLELVNIANKTLTELAADNAAVVKGDIGLGLPEQGPYDVILVEGGIYDVPEVYKEQLSLGGRLILFEMMDGGAGHAVLYIKSSSATSRRILFDAQLPVLSGFEKKTSFSF